MKRQRVDLRLFFSPFGQEFVAPELGVPQLTAYLTGRGFRVRQTDLNLLGLGPAAALCGREAPRFWQPSLRRGARLWNRGGHAYPLDEVLEAVADKNPEAELLYERHVRDRAGRAGLVGFSACTVDQALAALFFCRRIREDFPGLKTCLGGPWVGASWDALPGWPELFSLTDFMIGFSAEVPLERLIRHVRGELPISAVENLAYRRGRKVLRNPFRPSLPLEELPPPALDGFPLDRYVQPSLPYQTTQGCEWGHCSFCNCVFPKQAFDRKSPEKTLREMEALARGAGIRSFALADLSTPFEVLEGMVPHWRRMRAAWRAMARVHEGFTPAFARRLKASGCEYLFFGLETAGREGLGRLRKGIALKTVDATVRACAEAGVRVGLFALNYPGQSESELLRTLEFCVSRRRFLADLAVNRFKMGHWMTIYSDLPGRASSAAARDLNSFDVPYLADGVPIERFLELKFKAEGIVNGHSKGPAPGGTPR